jgi:hypothetical protein
MRRVRSLKVNVHPSLYEQMEKLRLYYRDKCGVNLSQVEQTSIISKNIKFNNLFSRNLLGGKNVKKKR